MELKWLEDFVSLARSGSFSRAAQDRNVTQPAFSRRIRALEFWLGVALVDRTIYPTALTRFGEEFLPYAKEIIENANGIRQEFRMATQSSRRQVKIITLHTLAIHVVPELVSPFLRSEVSSSVDIIPSIQGIEAYFEALETGTAQIVIAYAEQILQRSDKNIIEKIVAEDHFVPVVAKSYIENVGPIDFNSNQKVPMLMYSQFNFSHTILTPILKKIEDRITIRGESTLGESLKALVKRGFGVGWLPRYSVADEINSGELIVLPDASLQVPFKICAWRKESLEHAAARRLFESWIPAG